MQSNIMYTKNKRIKKPNVCNPNILYVASKHVNDT